LIIFSKRLPLFSNFFYSLSTIFAVLPYLVALLVVPSIAFLPSSYFLDNKDVLVANFLTSFPKAVTRVLYSPDFLSS
jgi:hypothetical protein